jgi:hypothetical protein
MTSGTATVHLATPTPGTYAAALRGIAHQDLARLGAGSRGSGLSISSCHRLSALDWVANELC